MKKRSILVSGFSILCVIILLSSSSMVAAREELHENEVWIALNRNSGVLSILDLKHNKAFFWIQDADALPFYEKASPFRTILQWWVRSRGGFLVHSAAVGIGRKGVLIAGGEYSGKSTTAVVSLLSGLEYAGDDYVYLRRAPDYQVYSLYCTAKLDPDHLRKMPALSQDISNQDRLHDEKALLFLHSRFSSALTACFSCSGHTRQTCDERCARR